MTRFLIGIDLGTTNCALAFVDAAKPHQPLQMFSIPQFSTLGKVDSLPVLPSFCYLGEEGSRPEYGARLPWKQTSNTFVGQYAKIEGSRVPTRLVQSAKSWLCNSAADRRDKILPVEAANIALRMSPVEASAKYLNHLRESWNGVMAKGDSGAEMEEQEIVLTVPASFDEVARTLTVEAARQAGLRHVTLLEEPQAAFYSWISQHEDDWHSQFKAGDLILVCDIGGGTTDFSLIEIEVKEEKLAFQRMAVGDHLLLGGDNMDGALAHYLEKKLTGGISSLDSNQWLQLVAQAREAKEQLLDPVKGLEKYTVIIQGMGSSVIKGSLSVEIERKEVEEVIGNGFFGYRPLEEALHLQRSRGFRTMGLPYEDEPSIIKHIAHFLEQAQCFKLNRPIDFILFNGGTMKPVQFQDAICHALEKWFSGKKVKPLPSVNLDLAVARGAAYYGKVRHGKGVAIGGGIPRTYYLELDVIDESGKLARQALTLLPRGSEEGHHYQPPHLFSLRANTPVAFHLLTSHVRLHDGEGSLHLIDEQEMQRLPPIQTILRFGKKQVDEADKMIPVRLGIKLTAIGTVELWLESEKTEHRWNLEFQVRSVSGQDNSVQAAERKGRDVTFEAGYLEEAKKTLSEIFNVESSIKPKQIVEFLEQKLEMPRREWAPSILRGLWEVLLTKAASRKSSADLEARWWNLAGFFLRPGFGYPLDDFRIKELWKIVLADLKNNKSNDLQIQMWICFRRIAGGLNKGQQMQLAAEIDPKEGEKRKGDHYLFSEKIRALGAMERLDLPLKMKWGSWLVSRIVKGEAAPADYWALGRIGARHLFYGSAPQVVPKEMAAKWIDELLKPSLPTTELVLFMFGQLARSTDHRELNVSYSLVERVLEKYPEEKLKKILSEHHWSESEQEQIFGEALPAGLILQVEK